MLPHLSQIIPKPWGHELIWANTEKYVGKILHVNKDCSLSLQYHNQKDETIHVLKGSIWLEIYDTHYYLKSGQGFRIYPGSTHRITAIEDSDVLEASTPHLDDVVRLQDNYNRK